MNDAWRWIILFVLAADYLAREGRGADLKHSVAFRVTFFAAVLIAIVLACLRSKGGLRYAYYIQTETLAG
jgi:hypothetical protein